MKVKNKEQNEYNKERIIDINLVLQYMESLDITKEYFTDIGVGHLRALGSLKDEIYFINKNAYDEIFKEKNSLQGKYLNKCKENKELKMKYNDLLREYSKLKIKKKWFK